MHIEIMRHPDQEPVSLGRAKTYLRVDHDHEDQVIQDLICAARESIQKETGYYIGNQEIQVKVPLIKRKGRHITPRTVGYMRGRTCLRLPISPVVSVNRVKVVSLEGHETEVPQGKYHPNFNTYPALIILDYDDKDTAVLDLTVGNNDVGSGLQTRILNKVADLYENRGARPYTGLNRQAAMGISP